MKRKEIGADEKLLHAVEELEHALEFTKKAKDDGFYYAGISKTFETCLEYAWKYLKRCAVGEGLEVYSPKDAIKSAGQLKMIDNVEKWLGFIEDRNLAVHDYLGISQDEYLRAIRSFLTEVKKLVGSK